MSLEATRTCLCILALPSRKNGTRFGLDARKGAMEIPRTTVRGDIAVKLARGSHVRAPRYNYRPQTRYDQLASALSSHLEKRSEGIPLRETLPCNFIFHLCHASVLHALRRFYTRVSKALSSSSILIKNTRHNNVVLASHTRHYPSGCLECINGEQEGEQLQKNNHMEQDAQETLGIEYTYIFQSLKPNNGVQATHPSLVWEFCHATSIYLIREDIDVGLMKLLSRSNQHICVCARQDRVL